MHNAAFFRQILEEKISKLSLNHQPAELYDPISYMLELGGKRLRPALVLMSAEMFGTAFETAIEPALGIEVFHNFTLMHDDIMDKAPLRRGKPTVHQKWNADIAILSGDTMFIKSVQHMMKVNEKHLPDVLSLFCSTAIEVCEGQQLDMNFEQQKNVTIKDYIHMIELKTAVLLACALKTGAIIANATEKDARLVYDFGKMMGIAFQLHDDILDVYADEKKFGKLSGGDILSNKKTFLFLKACELATENQKKDLLKLYSGIETDPDSKISSVKKIFSQLNIQQESEKQMQHYYQQALQHLNDINIDNERKKIIRQFANDLMQREF